MPFVLTSNGRLHIYMVVLWGDSRNHIASVLIVPGGGYKVEDDQLISGSFCPPPLVPETVMDLKFCRDKGNHVVTPRAGHSQGIFLLTDDERVSVKSAWFIAPARAHVHCQDAV